MLKIGKVKVFLDILMLQRSQYKRIILDGTDIILNFYLGGVFK